MLNNQNKGSAITLNEAQQVLKIKKYVNNFIFNNKIKKIKLSNIFISQGHHARARRTADMPHWIYACDTGQ